MAIWRIPTVKSELGHRSNTSIYTSIRNGLLTRAVPLSKRAVGWPQAEIQAICAARIAGNSDEEIRELVNALHQRRIEDAASYGVAVCTS